MMMKMFPAAQRTAGQLFFRQSPLMSNITTKSLIASSSQPMRGYLSDTRLGSNSNNFLVLDDNDGRRSPFLRFTTDGPQINLQAEMTLEQIEASLKSNGTIKREAEFFSPDGTRYAKCCTVREIMRFPFFHMRLDSWNEYHVHSSRAFKQSLAL